MMAPTLSPTAGSIALPLKCELPLLLKVNREYDTEWEIDTRILLALVEALVMLSQGEPVLLIPMALVYIVITVVLPPMSMDIIL